MQPAIKRGILSPCRRTARPPMNTMGQTALPGGIFLFCCLLAVLPAAANFSAAIASPTESPGYLASTTPQTPDYPADIPDLLQKLLSSDAQTRAAASRYLGTISPRPPSRSSRKPSGTATGSSAATPPPPSSAWRPGTKPCFPSS